MSRDSEEKIVELGKARYWATVRKRKQSGQVSSTPAGRYIVREATDRLAGGLSDWMNEAERKPGLRHTACPLLRKLPVEVSAFIITRACLDAVALRKSFMSVALHIGTLLEDEYRFSEIKRRDPTSWQGATKTFNCSGYSYKRRVLRSLASKRDIHIEVWTTAEKAHLGIVGINLLKKHTGIIEIHNLKSRGKTKTEISPTEEFLDWLEQSEKHNEGSMPFLLPLDEPPLPWSSLYSGGYKHPSLSGMSLVKTRSEAHKALLEKADLHKVYRAVNALQDTAFQINRKVYDVWEECCIRGLDIAGLPRSEPHEEPAKPDDIATNKEARSIWRTEAFRIKELNIILKAKRLSISNLRMVASDCLDQQFYYPYFCDFRGRVYAKGFFLNPMAGDLPRGLLEFAKAKPVSGSADWLRIQGANSYGNGINLKSIEDRCSWVSESEQRILSVAQDPLNHLWWADADDPWQFLAFCFDYSEFIKHGDSYSSRLCVSMDGRNNGLQNYAMLLRDENLAGATGCRPTDTPPDIYSKVAEEVTEQLKKLADTGKDGAYRVLKLFEGVIPRSICKLPVMVLPYGSTLKATQDHLIQWYWSEGRHMKVDGMSNHGFQECGLLASLIWATIQKEDVAASALRGMDYLRDVAKSAAADDVHLHWTTPSGFVACQSYVDQTSQIIKTSLGDGIRRHRLNVPTDRLDKRKSVSAFPANYIHSLDSSSLVETINLCLDEKGSTEMSFSFVHDSYGTHAADAPLLAQLLRTAHTRTFDREPLHLLHYEVLTCLSRSATLPDAPKTGSWALNELKKARYFFT